MIFRSILASALATVAFSSWTLQPVRAEYPAMGIGSNVRHCKPLPPDSTSYDSYDYGNYDYATDAYYPTPGMYYQAPGDYYTTTVTYSNYAPIRRVPSSLSGERPNYGLPVGSLGAAPSRYFH